MSKAIDPKNLEQRLQVVRLFLQMERYLDAQKELEGVIADFPKRQELAKEVQALRQLHARSIVKEIEVRRKAGQHALASNAARKIPAAGRRRRNAAASPRNAGRVPRGTEENRARCSASSRRSSPRVNDSRNAQQCEALLEEMSQELSINTLDRMAAYLRLADDMSLGPEQKISLAVSGWLLGSDQADTNLACRCRWSRSATFVRALPERAGQARARPDSSTSCKAWKEPRRRWWPG